MFSVSAIGRLSGVGYLRWRRRVLYCSPLVKVVFLLPMPWLSLGVGGLRGLDFVIVYILSFQLHIETGHLHALIQDPLHIKHIKKANSSTYSRHHP